MILGEHTGFNAKPFRCGNVEIFGMAEQQQDGWVSWSGGERGEDESRIWEATEIRLRDGRELDSTDVAACLRWRHIGDDTDIVAYRIAKVTSA